MNGVTTQWSYMKLVKIAIMSICIHMVLFNNINANDKKNTKTFSVILAKDAPIKTIIFDLGDVLTKASRKDYIMCICTMIIRHPSILHMLLFQNMKHELFSILHTVPAKSDQPMYNTGEKLPLIMVDWLTGRSNNEVLTKTLDCISQQNCSMAQKALFGNIVHKIFNPISFAESIYLVQSISSLAQSLKKGGYKLYVLSNWDAESFPLLKRKHALFFDLFDGIMISGTAGIGKPDLRFYQELLQTYNLNPNECVFIDDEPHNIEAANTLGIHGILNDSDRSVYLGLQKLGILQAIDR